LGWTRERLKIGLPAEAVLKQDPGKARILVRDTLRGAEPGSQERRDDGLGNPSYEEVTNNFSCLLICTAKVGVLHFVQDACMLRR
jgi:hypothetical protein